MQLKDYERELSGTRPLDQIREAYAAHAPITAAVILTTAQSRGSRFLTRPGRAPGGTWHPREHVASDPQLARWFLAHLEAIAADRPRLAGCQVSARAGRSRRLLAARRGGSARPNSKRAFTPAGHTTATAGSFFAPLGAGVSAGRRHAATGVPDQRSDSAIWSIETAPGSPLQDPQSRRSRRSRLLLLGEGESRQRPPGTGMLTSAFAESIRSRRPAAAAHAGPDDGRLLAVGGKRPARVA